MSEAKRVIDPEKGFVPVGESMNLKFLSEPDEARFTRVPESFVWISDIEHVIEEHSGEIYLADATKPYYLAGDRIPGGKTFELFPYHYYDKEEEEALGGRINYRLAVKNISESPVRVEIHGMGTVTDWDHHKTWEGAFRGDGKQSFELQPEETRTLWKAERLEGGLPWSGIVLGKASGDIWVVDYAYLSESDPGLSQAGPQPDLAWPPYLLASFTRGTADWNAAGIDLYPALRDGQGSIALSKLEDGARSMAIGYSPGGPITNLCEYRAVEPTFAADVLSVRDPLSGKSHVFFGGNYPIMYHVNLPLVNDSDRERTVNFYLCSNDVYSVDTLAGVWIGGKMLHRRVTLMAYYENWKVVSVTLKPGERDLVETIIVPLGSRWGGMIATVEVTTPGAKGSEQASQAQAVEPKDRKSPFGWTPGDYWIDHCKAFIDDNPKQAPGGTVFVGDSITERFDLAKWFPGMHLVNRGIGGDRVEGVMARLDWSASDLKPKALFLQIGINDLLWPRCGIGELRRRYALLLNQIKKACPDTRIVVQTLLPLCRDFAKHNDEVIEMNSAIRRLAMEHKFELADPHPLFLDEAGKLREEYTIDGVHLSEAGYAKWVELLKPVLETR